MTTQTPRKIAPNRLYQFNKAKAFVVKVTAEEIIWKDTRPESRPTRRTPRWFFEKHAVVL